MNDITIIIVNYNVRYFVEQCLNSVFSAKQHLKIEIIVVDNNSVDGSVESIARNYPDVKLIANKTNAGFAKANNQAIKIANSRYTLLLNPDTIVSEDTLVKAFDFMERNPEAGALGVKLIDGEGRFLPESKRAVPTPLVSFYRLSGLSKIFPKSRVFNRYNLGYLDENETNEVDVLCGAFMFICNEVFDKIGYLDEDFFMYGEDIDFSYRIRQAGYRIFYFPETTTIHFKGESTKKSSVKYHHSFYRAMSIFAEKHFASKPFNVSLFFINIAIIIIGLASFIRRKASIIVLPVIDLLMFFVILTLIQKFWANYYFHDPDYYPSSFTHIVYALFSVMSVVSIYLYNGYSRKYFVNSIKGILTAIVLFFVIYSLLPETHRFSRAIIVFGAGLSVVSMLIVRLAMRALIPGLFAKNNTRKNIAIVGLKEEADKVKRIMDINRINYYSVGIIYPYLEKDISDNYLGNISRLEELIEVLTIDEVIFCLKNTGTRDVVNYLSEIGNKVQVKIFPDGVQSIIGSSDRNSKGEFYSIDLDLRLNNRNTIIYKYILDLVSAFLLFLIFPIAGLISRSLRISDILSVIFGKKTWISYLQPDERIEKIGIIRPGVFPPVIIGGYGKLTADEVHDINLAYARNFSLWYDMEMLLRHLFETNTDRIE